MCNRPPTHIHTLSHTQTRIHTHTHTHTHTDSHSHTAPFSSKALENLGAVLATMWLKPASQAQAVFLSHVCWKECICVWRDKALATQVPLMHCVPALCLCCRRCVPVFWTKTTRSPAIRTTETPQHQHQHHQQQRQPLQQPRPRPRPLLRVLTTAPCVTMQRFRSPLDSLHGSKCTRLRCASWHSTRPQVIAWPLLRWGRGGEGWWRW